jgi:MFS family permease
VPFWACVFGHFAGDFGAYLMMASLPMFMKDVLDFDMTSLGFAASLPYVAYFIAINLGGAIADYVRSRGLLNTLNTRRAAMIIGM